MTDAAAAYSALLSDAPGASLDDLTEPRQPPSLTSDTSASHSSQQSLSSIIVSLLLWHDTLSSSLALGIGLLFVFLIQFGGYSLLTLLSYLCILQIVICVLFIHGTELLLSLQGKGDLADSQSQTAPTGAGAESNSDPSYISSLDSIDTEFVYVSADAVLEYSGLIADTLNSALNTAATVLRCRDLKLTGQVLVGMIVTSIAGRLLDGVTMLGLLYCSLFVLPKLYLSNQEQADQLTERINGLIGAVKQILGSNSDATGGNDSHLKDE